ncbi:Rrf2 family transcriptional regulator [bacterium]|nr:Rrf2 family transcriptional regulator [bacterium]
MRITALEEYGLRCMIILARCGKDQALTLPEISEREGLTVSYAGKLLMILRQADLVQAERGRHGGYKLAKPAESISLKEIFKALGEPVFNPAHCKRYSGENETCIHTKDCRVRDVWATLSMFIDDYLQGISLADLAYGEIKILKKLEAMKALAT